MNKKTAQVHISSKNTKDQILAAYNEAMKKLGERQNPQMEQAALTKQKVIDEASQSLPRQMLLQNLCSQSRIRRAVLHLPCLLVRLSAVKAI